MATSSFDKEFIVTDEEAIRSFLGDVYGMESESYKEYLEGIYSIESPSERIEDGAS